jgi:hypothetical protein
MDHTDVIKHSIYIHSEGKIDEELKREYNQVLHCIQLQKEYYGTHPETK